MKKHKIKLQVSCAIIYILGCFVFLGVISGCAKPTKIGAIEAIPEEVQAGGTAEVKAYIERPPSQLSTLRFQWLAERGRLHPADPDATPHRQYIAPNTPGPDRITLNLFKEGTLLDVKFIILTVTPGPEIGSLEVIPEEVKVGETAEVNAEIQNPPADPNALDIQGSAERGTLQPAASPDAPFPRQYIAPDTPGQDTITFKIVKEDRTLDEKSVTLVVKPGPKIGSIEVIPKEVETGETAEVRAAIDNPPTDLNALRIQGTARRGTLRPAFPDARFAHQYIAPKTPGSDAITLKIFEGDKLLDEKSIVLTVKPGPKVGLIEVVPEEVEAGKTAEVKITIENAPSDLSVLQIQGTAERGTLQPTSPETPFFYQYTAPDTQGQDTITLKISKGDRSLDEKSVTFTVKPGYFLLEGFENENLVWEPGKPQDYPDAPGAVIGRRSNDKVKATEGEYSYAMMVDSTEGDAVFQFQPDPPLDLSMYSALLVDVYTPDPQVKIALAISTGANWLWHESQPQELPHPREWTQLTFDLTASAYKIGSASQWNNPIRNLDHVVRIAFKIYPYLFTGSVYIDNIRLLKANK